LNNRFGIPSALSFLQPREIAMKKILLATDGSEPSLQAARFLAHLPHDETIELTIVSALFVPGTHQTYLVGDWIKTCLARERESVDQAYAEIASLFEGADVKLRHVVREGSPAETIVAIAKEEQPKLIVLGATGHSTGAGMLLGSTSDYVATHAPCSVLVVRPTDALTHLVHFDHIGEGSVHCLEGNDVDLVVVGETPRSRLSRVLMGSMTRYVLRHAPCSVWITRNRMIRGVKRSTQKTETATT